MGSVMHPVGKQPVWVYWARRAALVAAALVVLWLVISMFQPAPNAPVAAVPVTPSAAVTPTTVVSPSVSESPSASPTPTGPLVCDGTNSDLSVAGYQKVKQDGKQLFKVAVTNKSSEPCVLDLKPETFTFAITSGTDKIWTTQDCAKWGPTKKTSLKSKKAYEFTVEWPLKRSASGCRNTKDLMRPGTYVGTATLGDALSAKQVFEVRKA